MNEVISYLFMFAVGVLILLLSMQILGKSTEASDELGAGTQLKHVAELVAGQVHEAARVAAMSPTAAFHQSIPLPTSIDGRGYDVTLERTVLSTCSPCPDPDAECQYEGRVVASLDEEDLEAEVSLGSAPTLRYVDGASESCLDLVGTVHSSAGVLEVRFVTDPTFQVLIQSTNR